MKIGKAIKLLRKKRGINQTDFAKKLNLTQTSISQIETDKQAPTVKNIKSICRGLEISEPVLYLLSIEIDDVPEENKAFFKKVFPGIRDILFELFNLND